MPTANDFAVLSCQATLFTPDAKVSPAILLTRLHVNWQRRFDADPSLVSLPVSMPPEIPRLTFASQSGEWRCDIAPARVNVHWLRQQDQLDFDRPAIGEVLETCAALLMEYHAVLNARVARVAAVVKRFAPEDNPAGFLAAHFCKERWLQAPFNRPEAFELHAHKRFTLGPFEVNSWFRNRTGSVTLPDGERGAILVEQDFNTLPVEQETRSLDESQIRDFFSRVPAGLNETLRLYYPAT